MRRVVVTNDGHIYLGEQAARLGFVPGAVVEIIPTSAGSLLVVLDHGHTTYDVAWTPLVGGAAQLAARKAAGNSDGNST